MSYLSLENVSVGYNGKALIRDICIDASKGEIVTLIGPNGAGKSTILKSITKQLELISGKVIFDGRDMSRMSAKDIATRMAVVLTERIRPELMTCHDIVATGRYPYTGRLGLLDPEDEKKVDECLAMVNATHLGAREFSQISDGERQRILLARAICQEPDIIILDEPTSFLDIKHKLELLEILRRMAEDKGVSIVLSLHEIDLAEKISDKIVCVKGDRIFGYGRPEEIFTGDMISRLYDIEGGVFDPLFGSLELPPPEGEPEAFVISSGGSGIGIYRKLGKENTPFAAGILYENDIDYQAAKYMAVRVVSEKAFEKISDEAFSQAMEMVEQCSRVICGSITIGEQNRRIEELIRAAQDAGKLERWE